MGCTGSKARGATDADSGAEGRQRAPGAAGSKAEPRSAAAGRAHAARNGHHGCAQRAGGGGPAAVPSPDPRHLPSASSSDTGSDAGSDWDQYSWRLQSARGAASAANSTGVLSPRDTVGSLTLSMGSMTSQLRLRQDSLFSVSLTPRLEPVKDSGRLRLCKVSGVTFVNQYMVVKYLGRGSSGRVFLCMNIDDHRLYAVKIVKKDQAGAHKAARSGSGQQHRGSRRDPLEDLQREIAVMRRALHPNIVALREVVDDRSANKMLLVMDYLEGGPVMTREGLERGHRVPEDVARLYFRGMCRALDYLHCRERVVHGDLKPENALMGASGRIALSDFGCSKVMAGEGEEDGVFDRCNGTPAFLAPEMMRPHARYRGRPADVYALGGCLYAFVFGRIPFKADTVLQLFEVVQSQPVTFPPEVPASQPLTDLLLRMLEKNPARRLTLAEVMAHPWVTAGGALRPLQPFGRQPAAGAAAKRELGPAFDSTSSVAGGGAPEAADAAAATAHAGQQQQQQQQQQQADVADVAEAEEIDEEQEALLKASLEGLVSGELQVHSFAAGEPLMRRGQPGAHLMYILEGECEVLYRTAPAPSHDGALHVQPNPQATPGPMSGDGAAAAGAGSAAQQQQQVQQARQPAAPDRHGRPPMPTHVSRQRSAAGLFTGTCEAAHIGVAAASGRPGSGQADAAAAGAAALGTADTLGSSSGQLQTTEGAGGAKPGGALFARKTSSYIAEAADAAAADMAAAGDGHAVQPPAQQQAEGPEQQLQQPSRHQQLRVSLPGSDAGLLSAEPSALSEGAIDSPRRQEQRPGSVAPTPASAASSLAASPWPMGHQRRHSSVDMEGAAAHLQSPAGPQPPDGEAAGGRGAGLRHSSSGGMLAAAGEADGAAGGEQQQQQQQISRLPGGSAPHAHPEQPAQQHSQQQLPPRVGAPPLPPHPEVVGEELPPTLLEAATRAQELLGGLRRGGPRDFLVAVRAPGDFVGEMELLGGSQSRRVASVVAASPLVRAALIPYQTAKAYLAQHPLAKQQLAQLMWLRQSEDLVLEALARLALLGDDLLGMLHP